MQALLSLVVLIALVAAILGLFKPGLVLFFLPPEKRTRLKAFGLYAAVFVLCAFLLPMVSEPDKSDSYLAQLETEAQQAQAGRAPTTETAKAATTKTGFDPMQHEENIEALGMLLDSLTAFKGDPEFHKLGFGANLPYTHTWLNSVKDLGKIMTTENGYTLAQASAPGYLRQLGMEYMRSAGRENQYTRDFRKFVEEGLAK
ncbi:hypothetical protein [Pseudodesulfovibrio indicus]|uniref:Uncharacterized protein n=1 Tax=Pseudodesulfovibrio indicus TaxID=1716143 RepID=A0A126QM30_9BACT|nr:hypothetical protein [Pseudodesulfovibrio indicus]AMK10869.1 hypothetical protein AWY79_06985 [Pseudodesulfovibrio indicus]TDT91862.1 hypothetical protein EDC59_101265 [Pseudodesulfovibrio indicus]